MHRLQQNCFSDDFKTKGIVIKTQRILQNPLVQNTVQQIGVLLFIETLGTEMKEKLKIIAEQFQAHRRTKKKVSGCLAVYTLYFFEDRMSIFLTNL